MSSLRKCSSKAPSPGLLHSLGTAVPRTLSLKPRGRVWEDTAANRSALGFLRAGAVSWAACRSAPRVGVAHRPAPPPRLPHLAPRPPRARRLGEPREGRTAAGQERGARATGPRAGLAYSAAGAGARDGAAAATSLPKSSAEGLVAGGGRLAGEDPGRGGLADWGPRAITQPDY